MTTPENTCFAPVTDRHTRVLVLGSLPGVASLQAQQYYAHPRNHFWRLIEAVIQSPLCVLPYEQRLNTLLAHRIGLWDVVAKARRQGSLDSQLRDIHHNDLQDLLAQLPDIRLVAFNGQTAGKAHIQLPAHQPYCILPSSSPAFTMPFEHKRDAWLQLATVLNA